MSPYDLAARLIDRFGKLLGLDGLALEGGSHSCALEFDGTLIVNFEFHEASSQIVLTNFPADLPGAVAEPVLRMLMAANFTDYLEGGITLGLVPQTQQVVLMQARSINELDDASFEKMVEAFVNRAEQWKQRLQEASSGIASDAVHQAPTRSTPGSTPAMPTLEARPMDGAHIFG